ncbi:hypothetical protein A2U01_0040521, partial [Trifolium medium]|nr:hypothetical protein [Trifolium medium]
MDLFRALAFKYGRFIEIDENTMQIKRCDVARVKIVTKKLKVIDSVMAVKVGDKRFEIRVIEETGDWSDGGGGLKVGSGWLDEQSSRASYGVESNCAVVEGCYSESGSDADVSTTCQVLLDIQTRGGDRSMAEGTLREVGYTEGEMSGNIPNLLGYSVDSLVNIESDKGEDALLETGEAEQVLEGE